jgi:hypothetical protein
MISELGSVMITPANADAEWAATTKAKRPGIRNLNIIPRDEERKTTILLLRCIGHHPDPPDSQMPFFFTPLRPRRKTLLQNDLGFMFQEIC